MKTVVVFVLISALAVAGVSATALADDHTNADVEIDGEGDEDIRYSTIVGLYGEPFDDSSNEYLIEASNLEEYDESTLEEITLNGNVIPASALPSEQLNVGEAMELGVKVDTGAYDQYVIPDQASELYDPQGSYVLREPIQGASVAASNQHPEAPQGIDVALDSFNVDGSGVATATSNTNANQVSQSDYTWAVELGPETGIVEDGSGTTSPSGALTLLDSANYNDINYDGLDGVYDLSNVGSDANYYPGSLSFTSGSFSSDFIERPTQGQLELDRGTNHIPVSTEVAVEYTDVNNPQLSSNIFGGGTTFSEGDQISLNNDFLKVNSNFPDSGSYADTSLNISLLSDRQVEVTYEIEASGATETTVNAVAPAGTATGSADESSTWNALDSRTIRTSNQNVLLDSISLNDKEGSLTTSDLEIIEANKGNGVEIRFPDLTGSADVATDRFQIDYTYIENSGGDVTQEITDEEIVAFGNAITSGDTRSLANSDVILEVSEGSVDYGQTFDITMNDQTLSTPDTVDLIAESGVQSGFNPADPSADGTDVVEFTRDIDQGVVEEFGTDVVGDTYLNAINPGQNPSIELGFDVASQQRIDVSYTHYSDSTLDVTETVVAGGTSGELGPTGQYQIDDPRTSEYAMELTGASSSDFDLTIEDSSAFIVSINEGTASGLSSSAELSQYTYSLGDDRIEFAGGDSEVTVNNDGTAELQYTLDHDRTQVDQDFIVEVETEDGSRSDSVTLTSTIPSGNSLGGSGTGTFVVDSMQMGIGIDYAAQLMHDGSVIAREEIEGGRNYDNYRLSLNAGESLEDLEGEDVTVQLMRYEGFNEMGDWVPVRNEALDTSDGDVTPSAIVQDTVTIDSQSGQLSFGAENEGSAMDSPLSQDWNLLPQFQSGDKNADDQRVFVNRLNIGESNNGPVNIPVGSEIVVSGNEFEPGDTLTLRREEDENTNEDGEDSSSIAVDITVEESDTVNENEIVINTSIPQVEEASQLEDRFEIVEPQSGDVVFNYGTTDQSLQANVDPERINLNRETTADLNISSDLTDYDVLISSEQLDAEELMDLLPSDVENEYNARIEDADDDENEQIRLENLNDRPETITIEVSDLSAQEYGLQISAVGSGASDSTTFETAFGSEGDATFADSVGLNDTQTFRVAEGDRARIGVQLVETDTATLSFDDNDFEMGDITVEAEDDREDFVLVMDTYLADGERVNGDDVSFTDVFSVRGGEFVNTPSLPPVEDAFETGLYPMNLEVDGRETDLATLVVDSRETQNVNTWVMPRDVEMNLENLEDEAVQQGEIAMEDTFIIELQMSGFDSPELLTNETDPSKLVNPYRRADLDDSYDTAQEFVDAEVDGVDSVANASQINLEVEGEKPRNRPSPQMLIGEAEEVETIVEEGSENRMFLFYDLTQSKFDNFNPAFDVRDNEDHLAHYDLHLNFSEEYKYVDDTDETDADLEEEFGVNERVIETRMPTQKVDEEDLETRYQLQPDVNSTVTGETYVAPGTELSIILQDDVEDDNVRESPLTLERELEVQEGDGEFNNVRGDFDLSELEEGREMTIDFFGINENEEEAIVAEPQTPPEIVELNPSSDGEGIRSGDEVVFESNITNVDPLALQYSWNFDDGSESSAPTPTNVFEEAGNYNVTLEVTDPATGLTDSAETQVVVTEVPRTAPEIVELIGPDAQVSVGQANEFAVVARDDQVAADDLIYEWDFADGTTATGITASHTYGVADTYEVQVTVSDPESPEELQTTESILVEVTGDEQDDGQNNTTAFDLTVNAVDSSANEPLPNAQVTIQDGSTQEQVDIGSTDTSGEYVGQIEEGNYIVQVTASGYEDFSTGTQVTGNDTIQADMVPEDSGSGNDSSSNNPDQPGFTLILAALGLVGAGGYIYYRRRTN